MQIMIKLKSVTLTNGESQEQVLQNSTSHKNDSISYEWRYCASPTWLDNPCYLSLDTRCMHETYDGIPYSNYTHIRQLHCMIWSLSQEEGK